MNTKSTLMQAISFWSLKRIPYCQMCNGLAKNYGSMLAANMIKLSQLSL